MRGKNKLHYKRKSPVVPILISIFAIVGAAFGAAWVWQNMQDTAMAAESPVWDEEAAQETDLSAPEDAEITAPSVIEHEEPISAIELPKEAESGDVFPEEAEDDIDELPVEETALEKARRETFPYALQKTETVPASYFDDAIFFGDSISTGIPLYNVMPNADVIAYTGISTVNVLDTECISTDDGYLTMLEAAKAKGDKGKIYIMLGGNGLGYDKETFIRGYEKFLDEVKVLYPNALIYIQSMTPVTDYVYKTYPSVSNELIEEYNIAIHDLAKEKKLYYLDVASALMNDEGKLPDEASPIDGMHFTPEYYAKWFAYLRNHAMPVKID